MWVGVENAGLGLSPVHLGNGEIYVGGQLSHFLNTNFSQLSQTGIPGVRPALSVRIPPAGGQPTSLLDAETFTIQLGITPVVTFELNNTDVDPLFNGDLPINFNDLNTQNEIADIRKAISVRSLPQ